ncbi:MAG: WD40 repeat domain-containing protein [Gemmataceae bacterium]
MLANLAVWREHVHSAARVGHSNSISTVAVSPDSRTIVTVDANTLAHFWDADTGRRMGDSLPHPDVVYDVAFSPDGAAVLTGCRDGRARLWSVKARNEIGQPFTHRNSVTAVAFRPDGKVIATGCVDRIVRLWDPLTGKPVGETMPHGGDVTRITFRPDGKFLLTADNGGAVHRWDAATGKQTAPPVTHDRPVHAIAWGPGGRYAVVCHDGTRSSILDADGWKFIDFYLHHQVPATAVAVNLDGHAVTCHGQEVLMWDLWSMGRLGATIQHQTACAAVAYVGGGKRLLTGCSDGSASLWNLGASQPVVARIKYTRITAPFVTGRGAISPDGRFVAVGSLRGEVECFQLATGNPVGSPRKIGAAVVSMKYSPDGKTLLVGDMNKIARLYDAGTLEPVGPPLAHHGIVKGVAFSVDGRTLVSVAEAGEPHRWDGGTGRTNNGMVYVWDAAGGKPTGPPVTGLSPGFSSIAVGPNNKAMLVCGHGGAWLLRLPSGQLLQEFKPGGRIDEVAFSPDGKLIATGSQDKVAQIWHAEDGRPLTSPLPHNSGILHLQFSPDGRYLLTGTVDGSALLWDVVTGRRVGPAFQSPTHVLSLAFEPAGDSVVAVDSKGLIIRWNVRTYLHDEPGRLALLAQVLTARELDKDGGLRFLSDAEWRQRKEQLAAFGGSPLP